MKGLVVIASFYVFFFFHIFSLEEVSMANKDLKKFLAGLGVAGLISAGGISLPGAHAAGSG
jgi:radical SAM modification target selenobiotic family peptide